MTIKIITQPPTINYPCKECKYFRRSKMPKDIPENLVNNFGLCTLFIKPDKKLGKYGYTINAYDFICKGDYFDKK